MRRLDTSGDSESFFGRNVTVVDMSLCLNGSSYVPPAVIPCDPCEVSFCNTTQCSNHGTCDADTQACVCDSGYSGVVCQRSSTCGGPMDHNSTCCGVGGILTRHKQCCSGTNPVLARNGTCCPSGVLNACGYCDGNPNATGM